MDMLVFLMVAFCFICIIGMALMYHYANRKCRHMWSVVTENDLQYCDLCGMARKPTDETFTRKCTHKWGIKDSRAITVEGRTVGHLYVLKCEICGDISSRKVSVDD